MATLPAPIQMQAALYYARKRRRARANATAAQMRHSLATGVRMAAVLTLYQIPPVGVGAGLGMAAAVVTV